MKKAIAVLMILLGAGAGYAYYYFVGCVSGTCRITSDPLFSTLYGGLLGFVIAAGLPIKPKASRKDDRA